jgi:signal transduction histidine kinase
MDILHHTNVWLALAAVVINGIFVLLVLTRTSRTTVYVTFLFCCGATMVWNFGDFMQAETGHQFWFYLSLIGTGFIPAFMFHFANALVRPAKHRIWILVSYALCLPFALSSPLAIVHPRIRSFVDGLVWNVLFILLLYALFVAAIFLLIQAIRASSSKSEASRLRYILVAALIACITGTTELIQGFGLSIPRLGHLGSLIYPSILAIGVFKHRAAYDLLAAMQTKLDMFNELSAGIAHELRNPLSSISGAANLLMTKSRQMTDVESRQYLSLISEEVDRLSSMLNNYGCLVRPVKIEKELISVLQVLEKTIALMRLNVAIPRIETAFSQENIVCNCDASTLRQVFINLIKNAAEACGPEGTLIITAEREQDSVSIIFQDSGDGVPPEILPRLFEPFVSTKKNSMGLGLAICRRLIDLNGGTIDVANEAGGARFTIHLPVAGSHLNTAATSFARE